MRTGDRIGGSVTLGGTDISDSVDRVVTRFGWDMRVAECSVTFALTPPFLDYGELVVRAGLTSRASDTSGPSTLRFSGVSTAESTVHYPYSPGVDGKGWLTLADNLLVPEDFWGDGLLVPDPYLTPAAYLPPGIDMTDNGLGATDVDQVLFCLDQAGLTGKIDSIGGLSVLFGTQVRAMEQFVWTRGQSALSYIESLDGLLGFRTFDTPAGLIRRESISNLVPVFGTVMYTLDENRDVLGGGSIARDYGMVRNRVHVTGYDPGGGGNVFSLVGAASPLPPDQSIVTEYRSSPLIERLLASDPGDGLACDQVAAFWLGELQYPMFEATVPTWRDDPFKPGDIVYLNCPHLLGVNQAMTVKHVECDVTASTFTQTLVLRAQDYSIYRGPGGIPLGGTPGGPTDVFGVPLGPTLPTGPTGGPLYFPGSLPLDLG